MFKKSLNNILSICDKVILLNYKLVREAFKWVIEHFKKRNKKIRWIILGEAPLSYSEYFYNPVNKNYTVFLTKKNIQHHIQPSIKSKYDAIIKLVDKGILIIDIYPLPVQCSKNLAFYDGGELKAYWDEVLKDIQPFIEKSTKITHRYKRLLSNSDAKKFVDLFDTRLGTDNKKQHCIGSANMGLNQKEFDKLF